MTTKKKPAKVKLNYQQRVVATPHCLNASEEDRAHKTVYFILDTLAEYQKNFLKREYMKFCFELPAGEALKRIDEEMSKVGMNVMTLGNKHGKIILNVHFAIYEYRDKKFLCPRMIIRDLRNKEKSLVDGAPVLIAPHCLARMLARSGMEFKDAIKLLGQSVLQLMWANGEDKTPSFNQSLWFVDEVGISDIGTLRCGILELEDDLTCDGELIKPAGASFQLIKTWIDDSTLPDDYFSGKVEMINGEIVN